MHANHFPSFLFVKGEDGVVVKKLFQTPFEVTPGDWFEDGALTTPYTPPAHAARNLTDKDRIASLENLLEAVRAQLAAVEAFNQELIARIEAIGVDDTGAPVVVDATTGGKRGAKAS